MAAMAGPSTALEATCSSLAARMPTNDGQQGDQQRADADARHRQHGGPSLGGRNVHQPAARQLADEPRDAAGGKHQPDVGLVPLLRGEIDGQERTKPGLDIGHEEGEPIEAALARSGSGSHYLGSLGVRPRRVSSSPGPAAPSGAAERDSLGADGLDDERRLVGFVFGGRAQLVARDVDPGSTCRRTGMPPNRRRSCACRCRESRRTRRQRHECCPCPSISRSMTRPLSPSRSVATSLPRTLSRPGDILVIWLVTWTSAALAVPGICTTPAATAKAKVKLCNVVFTMHPSFQQALSSSANDLGKRRSSRRPSVGVCCTAELTAPLHVLKQSEALLRNPGQTIRAMPHG